MNQRNAVNIVKISNQRKLCVSRVISLSKHCPWSLRQKYQKLNILIGSEEDCDNWHLQGNPSHFIPSENG